MRHGMTVGELAQLFNQHFGIAAKLRVIPMNGWHRSMLWPDTGLHWVRTSPNVPTWQTTFVYLCTGLLDGANINGGVGTNEPFFFAGVPGLDGGLLAERLTARKLPGVKFDPAVWSPSRGGAVGIEFSGVKLVLTSRVRFTPVRTAVEILVAIRDIRPSTIEVTATELDRDWGTDSLRIGLTAGKSAEAIVTLWRNGLHAFAPVRAKYLLYT
jgi:uncharacterized protein YbbC (DUF1343 family)